MNVNVGQIEVEGIPVNKIPLTIMSRELILFFGHKLIKKNHVHPLLSILFQDNDNTMTYILCCPVSDQLQQHLISR